jgi:hypothetical protein
MYFDVSSSAAASPSSASTIRAEQHVVLDHERAELGIELPVLARELGDGAGFHRRELCTASCCAIANAVTTPGFSFTILSPLIQNDGAGSSRRIERRLLDRFEQMPAPSPAGPL